MSLFFCGPIHSKIFAHSQIQNSKGTTPEDKWLKHTHNVYHIDVRLQLMLNFETEMWLIILWYGLPQVKVDKKTQ